MRIRNQFVKLMAPDPAAGGGTGDAGTGTGTGTGAGTGDAAAAAVAAAAKATADAAAAAAAKGGTGAGTGDAGAGTTPAWPENWRTQISADEKHQKTLSRFDSPKALWESYQSLTQRMSSGELKAVTPFPDKGKPEEQAAWRKDNGVPDTPDKYDLKGVTVDELHKPVIDGFLKKAHELHAPAGLVKELTAYYLSAEEARIAEGQVQDKADRQAAEDALRTEYGQEYRTNVNLIANMLKTAPNGVGEKLATGRLGDGRAFMNDPDIVRWLVGLSRELNPTATIVPEGGAGQMASVETEIAAIEKRMREDRKGYMKDNAAQERYRNLITFRDKNKK